LEQRIRFCTTPDQVRLAYSSTGTGYPLVKAANWLTHLEYDWHSPVWRHWWKNLSERFTLHRYDERGCGLSDWDLPEFSFDSWVRDLEAVTDALQLDRFALLGISQGAAVSIAYAVKHPQRVSHLILYGGYAQGWLKCSIIPPNYDEIQTLAKVVEVGWGKDNPAFRQLYTSLFIPGGTLEQFHWFNELSRISTSPSNAARFIDEFNQIDVYGMLAQVQVPTLVMHCRNEVLIPFDRGRLLAARIPNAQFVPLESKNHLLLETEPAWSEFLAEIVRFIGPSSESFREEDPSARPHAERSEFHAVNPVPPSGLTEREYDVLELIAAGLSNTQISEQLVLSPKTVKNHITHIFSKLQVSTRSQAIVRARKAGIGIDLGP
jgi:pimeloyl-ACP methyl ester carboxylesterase/DNA-binding CsgD family transcriptional regulator